MAKNLGGVGGCGAFIVVQAATTPPRRKQLSIQMRKRRKPASMQAGKTMLRRGMFEADELTITGASKEPGF